MVNHARLGGIHTVKTKQVLPAGFGNADDPIHLWEKPLPGPKHLLPIGKRFREQLMRAVVMSSDNPPGPHHGHSHVSCRVVHIHFATKWGDHVTPRFVYRVSPGSRWKPLAETADSGLL